MKLTKLFARSILFALLFSITSISGQISISKGAKKNKPKKRHATMAAQNPLPKPIEQGRMQVCNIAGPGVEIETPFTFDIIVDGAIVSTKNVLAGPAFQNGFCNYLKNTFDVGATVTVIERATDDVVVSHIKSSTGDVTANLETRTGTITIVSGVSEVEFTNASSTPPPAPTPTPDPTPTS
jgi:hypothetical protein